MYRCWARYCSRSRKLLMRKILLALILILVSSQSLACLLVRGEIKINKDKLLVHQKFKIDETYPYRTENHLVHIKLLSKKIDSKQVALITIRDPKTFKILGKLEIILENNLEVKASMTTSQDFIVDSILTLKHI